MRPSEILESKLSEIKKIMKENKYFTNLRVFGSVVDGTDTENSDIDFLVNSKEGCSLFDQVHLHSQLESILGVKIDLIDENDLLPLVKKNISNIRAV